MSDHEIVIGFLKEYFKSARQDYLRLKRKINNADMDMIESMIRMTRKQYQEVEKKGGDSRKVRREYYKWRQKRSDTIRYQRELEETCIEFFRTFAPNKADWIIEELDRCL